MGRVEALAQPSTESAASALMRAGRYGDGAELSRQQVGGGRGDGDHQRSVGSRLAEQARGRIGPELRSERLRSERREQQRAVSSVTVARNTSAAAATSPGRMRGSVTRTSACSGPQPSERAEILVHRRRLRERGARRDQRERQRQDRVGDEQQVLLP